MTMKAQIRNAKMEAVIVNGRGYADIQAAVEAMGGPTAVLMAALGIPTIRKDGALLVALRPLAERLNMPHQYQTADDTFYVDAEPPVVVPPLPTEPVGAGANPWAPVTPAISSRPDNRRPDLLEAILRQFQVAVNPRYRRNQQGYDETYCNIYVWDCTSALGCEVPHWVDAQDKPASPGYGRELDANGVVLWMSKSGLAAGWKRVGYATALDAANAGRPAVMLWLNPGGIGHVAMVRPGHMDARKGIPIAQAGATNFDDGYETNGFGSARAEAEFWIHD
jgi:hypothetical protein